MKKSKMVLFKKKFVASVFVFFVLFSGAEVIGAALWLNNNALHIVRFNFVLFSCLLFTHFKRAHRV